MADQHKHESKPGANTPAVELDIVGDGLMTREEIEATIARYESMFGMSSEEFLRARKAGLAPDTFEALDWANLLKHR